MAGKSKPVRSCLLSTVLAVVVVSVLSLLFGRIVRGLANRHLPGIIGTDAHIGRLELSVLNGWVVAEDVTVAQPEGFGDRVLLSIPYARVDISMASLFRPPLTVEHILIRDAVCTLARDTNKVFNLQALVPVSTNDTESVKGYAPGEEREPDAEDEAGPVLPALHVRFAELKNAALYYVDAALSRKPLEIQVRQLDCVVSNLVVDVQRANLRELPATAWATGRIVQKDRDAMVGLGARVGIVGTNIPPVNAMFRLNGLELNTVRAILPPGTEQTLGGDCLDVRVSIAVSPDLLDIDTDILTSANRLSLSVGGTPAAPQVDTSNVLFLLLARSGGGVGSLALNLGKGTVQAADSAINTTVTAVKGVGQTVGSFLGGVLTTAKGIVTADAKTIGEGLEQATVGTVKDAVGTVTDTTGALADGVVETGRTAVGEKGASDWRKTCGLRWTNTWAAVPAALYAMPFPGAETRQLPPEPEPGSDGPLSTNAAADAESVTATNAPAGGESGSSTNAVAEEAETPAAPPTPSPRAGEELLHD